MSDTKNLEYYLKLPYTIILRRDEDGDTVARIAELPGCSEHGGNAQEALENLEEAKRLWVAQRIKVGQPIPEPEPEEPLPSGKWVQRVPRTIHKKLSLMAETEKVSLNALVTSMLSDALAARSIRDQFKIWVGEVGFPFGSHGIVPLEHLYNWRSMSERAEAWTGGLLPHGKRGHTRDDLLFGLDVTRRLLTTRDESTDAYDPKKEFAGHKKELASARR